MMKALGVYCVKGELTITAAMESLGNSLFMDVVPESWAKRAYPSLYGLSQWYADMLQRVKELDSWTGDFQLPPAVWLAGFFNPQSFLTAIMQQVIITAAITSQWWRPRRLVNAYEMVTV